MADRVLIEPQELNDHLGDENWLVFDCRHTLADPDLGEEFYEEYHIPDARFAHLDRNLCSPVRPGSGRHPLPEESTFIAWLGSQGATPDHTIVVYDDTGGSFAGRLWWMLKYLLHHERVYVLNGGLEAWEQANLPTDGKVPMITPATYGRTFDRAKLVTLDQMKALYQEPGMVLVDARDGVRYRGEQEPLDPTPGHIPGAINLPFMENMNGNWQFRPTPELKTRYAKLAQVADPENVIWYCGSGVTACHGMIAMVEAGYDPGRLYVGSWSEWCADPERPVETQTNPS